MPPENQKVSSHQEALDIASTLKKKLAENTEEIRKQGKLQSWLNGKLQETEEIYKVINKDGIVRNKISKENLQNVSDQIDTEHELGNAIQETLPGITSFAVGAERSLMAFKTMLGPIGIAVGIFVLLAKFAMDIAKGVADTRKELGVSNLEAAKLNIAFKGLEYSGKIIGLEAEDFKESFKAARDNLGSTTDEALSLSFNLAKVAMQSGTTADQLTQVLSVMESVSGASRDALLSQIEMNRQLIEQAGLAPSDIFRDIADNAEFFAEFAKAGSNNLVQAGIAAKKLGLNMSAVAGITNSLLEFETSIEKQMEASMLLGRQINLDRARQLALAGDQEGMMREVLKQVGGEAEFNRMNVIQRRTLAESVGVNVEQLSRLVRNNAAAGVAGVGGAVGAAMGDHAKVQAENSGKMVGVLGEIYNENRKQTRAMEQ